MVVTAFTAAWLAISTLLPLAQVAGENEPQERTFRSTMLYAGSNDQVWLTQPLVHPPGMLGVAHMYPMRLSPAVAERLKPLTTRLAKTPKLPDPWWRGLPQTRTKDDPLILLHLKVSIIPQKHPQTQPSTQPTSNYPDYHEVTEAELREVEFIVPPWPDALALTNESLNQIVALTRSGLGERKKQLLTEAIDRTAQALGIMSRARIPGEYVEKAREIEPAVRVTQRFQNQVLREFQARLEDYAGRLGLPIGPPLPAITKHFDPTTLLAESSSPAELLATIKEGWGEERLEDVLFSSVVSRRPAYKYEPVFVYELSDMAPERFQALQAEARERLEERQKHAAATAPAESSTTCTIDELGVVVRAAEPDLLAKELILAGLVVEKVLTKRPDIDIEVGDIIISYDSPETVAVYGLPLERKRQWVTSTWQQGREVLLIRGDRVISLKKP